MIRHTALRRWMALAVLTLALGWPAAALAVAVSNPLTSVNFSDATNGFISGYSSSGTMPSTLSYTHDGGLTWHAHIVPNRLLTKVTASADGVSASAVGMPTDAIQSTANSGLTWAEQAPVLNRFVDLMGFAYLSGNRRVVVGRLTPSNQLAVIASSVSGGAWNIDFQGPYHASTDPDVDPPVTYAKLVAIDSAPGGDVAWAAGEDHTDSVQVGPWPVLLYKTTDGGSTWTTQTISALTPQINCLSVADTQTAFIGQSNRTLLRTRDGSTWQEVTTVPSVAWAVNPINALDALDKDHLLIVGDNGRIGWSSNASADVPTFTVTTTQTVTGTALRGAQMLDDTHWIVVGDNETILRTADGGKTWTGSKQMTAPTLKLTSPTRSSMLASTTISIEGTASDGPGVGVAGVEVKVQGGTAGWYWSGSAWQPAELWLPASTTDGWNSWSLEASLDSTASLDNSMTIMARARDGLSNVSTSLATVRSLPGSTITITSVVPAKNPPLWRGVWTFTGKLAGEGGSGLHDETVTLSGVSSTGAKTTSTAQTAPNGTFTFTVNPDRATTYSVRFAGTTQVNASTSTSRKIFPPALIGTPGVPSYMTHTKYFTAYADLWPIHTPKTLALTLYFERYQLVGSVRKWVVLKTVSASALTKTYNGSTRSRCSASVKLLAGKSWRVRARHWDADHLKTYSAYKYFRVY